MESMAGDKGSRTVREAVGVFADTKLLQDAVDDLKSSGFDQAEIGLLAGEFAVKQRLGELASTTNESSGVPNAPHTDFVAKESIGDAVHGLFGGLKFMGAAAAGGAVVATAGILGGAIATAAAGVAAVGTVGAVLAALIGEDDAENLERQIDSGHLLLFVRTRDPTREKLATGILSKHSAIDVRLLSVA